MIQIPIELQSVMARNLGANECIKLTGAMTMGLFNWLFDPTDYATLADNTALSGVVVDTTAPTYPLYQVAATALGPYMQPQTDTYRAVKGVIGADAVDFGWFKSIEINAQRKLLAYGLSPDVVKKGLSALNYGVPRAPFETDALLYVLRQYCLGAPATVTGTLDAANPIGFPLSTTAPGYQRDLLLIADINERLIITTELQK